VSQANGMLISIITPTFNSGNTIERNVRSIVTQSYKHFEHIIVDNNSKDNTINIINKVYEEYNLSEKLRVIIEDDNGIAEAFNKGIKKAKGEIIAILNGDDEYYHSKVFEEVAGEFTKSGALIVYGNVYFYDPVHGSNVRFPLSDKTTGGIQFIHPAMFLGREVYGELGLYDETFRLSMDYEYYCRLAKKYGKMREKFAYLSDKPLVRMNAGGASWNNELKSIDEIKKALIRHGFWNKEAKKFYAGRKLRTKLKKYFTKLGLNLFVKIWRRIKYGN